MEAEFQRLLTRKLLDAEEEYLSIILDIQRRAHLDRASLRNCLMAEFDANVIEVERQKTALIIKQRKSQKDHADSQLEVKRLESAILEMKTQDIQQQSKISRLESDKKSLSKEIDDIKEKIGMSEARCADLKRELEQLQRSNRKSLESKAAELMLCKSALETVTKERDDLKSSCEQVAHLRYSNVELGTNVKTLTTENGRLNAVIGDYQASMAGVVHLQNDYRGQIVDLQAQMARIATEKDRSSQVFQQQTRAQDDKIIKLTQELQTLRDDTLPVWTRALFKEDMNKPACAVLRELGLFHKRVIQYCIDFVGESGTLKELVEGLNEQDIASIRGKFVGVVAAHAAFFIEVLEKAKRADFKKPEPQLTTTDPQFSSNRVNLWTGAPLAQGGDRAAQDAAPTILKPVVPFYTAAVPIVTSSQALTSASPALVELEVTENHEYAKALQILSIQTAAKWSYVAGTFAKSFKPDFSLELERAYLKFKLGDGPAKFFTSMQPLGDVVFDFSKRPVEMLIEMTEHRYKCSRTQS